MIKFFRNIRRKLVAENKFLSYLRYSVGEILLVVVGILIALSINNWDNDNQQKLLEIKYLNELKNNLESDLIDIASNIIFNEGIQKSNIIVLNHINNDLPYSDSLDFHFGNLMGLSRTVANMSAYENLKSRGFEIISNDSLRRNITYLYSFVYKDVVGLEFNDDHLHHFHILYPAVLNAVDLKTMWEEAKPFDYRNLSKDHLFMNALSTNLFFRKFMIERYNILLENIEELIIQIESELDK